MLQIYIMRSKQMVDEQDDTEQDDDQDDTKSPSKLFNELLKFWKATRDITFSPETVLTNRYTKE